MRNTLAKNPYLSQLYLVTHNIVDLETRKVKIGGMETYADALIRLGNKLGWNTTILQKSTSSFDFTIPEWARVISWKKVKDLRATLRDVRRENPGMVILFEPFFAPDDSEQPTIYVQHGIGYDGSYDRISLIKPLQTLVDLRRSFKIARIQHKEFATCSSVSRVVCVDTNFINAMRLAFPAYDWGDQFVYLPNFGENHPRDLIDAKWQEDSGRFVVLLARRFAYVRGVYLWLDCLRQLAMQFPKADFRLCGYGDPAEKILREFSKNHQNVKVYQRPYAEMRNEYKCAHICVVPSLWSEGTSLSCIEAMTAGCAVVTSDVGGLGNLVIPDFNGLVVAPTVTEFTSAVGSLLSDANYAKQLAMKGYDLSRIALSREIWERRMSCVFENVMAHPIHSPPIRRIAPC